MKDLLPPYELLTKAQDEALRYDEYKSMLITGPPGSGKTVVALYRAGELIKKKRTVHIIVYNRVLHSYISKSFDQLNIDSRFNADKFHSWFCSHIRKTFHRSPPTLDGKYRYDWDKLYEWYSSNDSLPILFDQLIIDEGQDIPVRFYGLASRMSKSITVFADENQAIYEGINSTINEIRKALRRFAPKEIELKKNHRNTEAVANFASLYMTAGLNTGITETPTRKGELPLLCRSDNRAQQIEYIVQYAKNHRDQQIGVFLYWKNDVLKWMRDFRNVKDIPVQYYVYDESNTVPPPNFDETGIFVIAYPSAKGIEFDAVFVPEIDKTPIEKNTDIMLLYVVFSRPRDRLVIMYEGHSEPEIISNRLEGHKDNTQEIVKRIDLRVSYVAEKDVIVEVEAEDSLAGMTVQNILNDLIDYIDEDDYDRFSEVLLKEFKENSVLDKDKMINFIKSRIPSGLTLRILPHIHMLYTDRDDKKVAAEMYAADAAPDRHSMTPRTERVGNILGDLLDALDLKIISEKEFSYVSKLIGEKYLQSDKVNRMQFASELEAKLPREMSGKIVKLIING